MSGFLRSVEAHPERIALEVRGHSLTYEALFENAASIAATLQRQEPSDGQPLTAVLAHRSATAFGGILGALLSGHGYVPLNPNFPTSRTANMLSRSGAKRLIVGSEALPALESLLPSLDSRLTVLVPDLGDVRELAQRFSGHAFIGNDDLASSSDWSREVPPQDEIAYLLFTSGSTGQPKGVPITHANIRHFIDVVTRRYEITADDRFSQMFELVFDLSLFDMFVAWESGACLCCPSKEDAQLPGRFVRESRITVWFSVPSLALHMKQMRMLRADAFPDLRLVLFCGEALLEEVVEAWIPAAPNAVIENVYGPTEVTLACTAYRWDPAQSPAECEHGLVPIGEAFPGLSFMVADESFHEVAPGETGELLMAGPQVAPGYWYDEEKTRSAFITPPDKDRIFYRTGDLVRRPENSDRPIKYLGRIDHQIKIRGNRVELGEIEAVMRDAARVDLAVAIGWPRTASGADAITAFLQASPGSLDESRLREQLSQRLPVYMVPKEFRLTEDIPLNPNGKVDRKALLAQLEDEQATPRAPAVRDRSVPERDAQNADKGVVILGCPRSGTTLMRRLIDSHPDIACPGETCLLSAGARFLHAEIVSDGLEFGVLNGLAFAGFPPEETLQRLREFTFGIQRQYAQSKGKRRWGEKTAIDVFHLDEIERLCADEVQYIVVLRHGLDVACSLKEFSDRGYTYLSELHEYVARNPRPLEGFAHAWVDATTALLDLARRRPDQTLIVRYEDLVADPPGQSRRIFDFLGETWSEALLESGMNSPSAGGLGDWKAYAKKDFDATSIRRWTALPPGVVSRLAQICNPTLEICGYDPVAIQPDQGQKAARRRYSMAMKIGGQMPKKED